MIDEIMLVAGAATSALIARREVNHKRWGNALLWTMLALGLLLEQAAL